MILYTPMQLELVLQGLEEMQHVPTRRAYIDGVPVLIQDVGLREGKVVRVLSTDPRDYLRSDLYPGAVVRW
ncbi:YlzJ-like family protein [Desulfovirgula thermocuniculi]|uniref:YlzJ-like family protein n=1 Tax=Desulfovirgula thermocuniculi TaxID=348842 RepID=UPI00040E2A0F|nr:YlzJ-like family protein [Desulfovirgula thermocuniculi]